MIDVRLLRSDPDAVRTAMARRGSADLMTQLEQATAVDERLRLLAVERDDIRRQVNELSKQVGMLRRDGQTADAEIVMDQSRALGAREAELAAAAENEEVELRDLLLRLPNLPHPDAPDGAGEDDNPVVKGPINEREWAEHQRVPHWETGAALGILDNERAVKISGSMFTMLRGGGATMSRALCQYALDRNADAFEEIRPPSLVTSATLTATGQLPKSPTTPMPSSATTCGASRRPRCRSRASSGTRSSRIRAAQAVDGVHPVLPA
ncbi:MAG: hypothetical protein R2715_05865 [Ilumatobacteraceae bacterium]